MMAFREGLIFCAAHCRDLQLCYGFALYQMNTYLELGLLQTSQAIYSIREDLNVVLEYNIVVGISD